MNRLFSVFLFSLVLFLCSSCEREDPIVEPTFIVGEPDASTNYFAYETPIHIVVTQNKQITQPFDLDNDNVADISVVCRYSINSNYYHQKSVTFTIQNKQFEICNTSLSDTVFQFVTGTSPVYRKIFNTLTFTQIDNSLTTILNHENYLCPKMFAKGESLSDNELWSSQTSLLTFSEMANYNNSYEIVDHDLIKGQWNNQEKQYLVFRKKDGPYVCYGWIKLKITDYTDVTIYEQSIQQ